jgi:hypothetical protein
MRFGKKEELVARIDRGHDVWHPRLGAYVGDLAFAAYTDVKDGDSDHISFELNGVRVTVTKAP